MSQAASLMHNRRKASRMEAEVFEPLKERWRDPKARRVCSWHVCVCGGESETKCLGRVYHHS